MLCGPVARVFVGVILPLLIVVVAFVPVVVALFVIVSVVVLLLLKCAAAAVLYLLLLWPNVAVPCLLLLQCSVPHHASLL